MIQLRERGTRIRQALRDRHIAKAYGLAADLGVDQSAISRWKQGGPMSLENAVALCDHLDISLDWLLLGRGGMDRSVSSQTEGYAEAISLLSSLPPPLLEACLQILRALAPQAPCDD